MNEDDHNRFLEAYGKWQEARREVDRITAEHIWSGSLSFPITWPETLTSANFPEWRRRLTGAKAEEQRLWEEVTEFLPNLPRRIDRKPNE